MYEDVSCGLACTARKLETPRGINPGFIQLKAMLMDLEWIVQNTRKRLELQHKLGSHLHEEKEAQEQTEVLGAPNWTPRTCRKAAWAGTLQTRASGKACPGQAVKDSKLPWCPFSLLMFPFVLPLLDSAGSHFKPSHCGTLLVNADSTTFLATCTYYSVRDELSAWKIHRHPQEGSSCGGAMNVALTRTFCLGLLLVVATAFPTPLFLEEDSKDATTSARSPLTTPNTGGLISTILSKIDSVKEQLCKNDETCTTSKEALTENNLNLPKLEQKDGCFHTGFNQETCLIRLTSGLLEYQVYLKYLEDTYKEDAKTLQAGTRALLEYLKQRMHNPVKISSPDPTTNAILLEKMKMQNGWKKTTTMRLILQSLKLFMEFAQRAHRIILHEQQKQL
ncbi:interleukin-6 [Rhynchonycteris naso]